MPQLLSKGQTLRSDANSQYVVTRRLGEGQFAEVWEVRQCNTGSDLRFALKLEKYPERKSVVHESKMLSKLPGKSDQVVRVLDTGYHGKSFFFVMELLGDTLFDMRKQAGGRMDLPCVKAVGLSTLAALEGLHAMGFIHRDIKPANFVISPPNAAASRGKWVLIDFGLARKYLNDDGSHMEPRPEASFRGSTAYASVHAHRDEDLSRRDDLWSWFYMLLELVEGCLLWRLEKDDPRDHDKQWVLQEKHKCWEQPELLARSKLPDALLSIHSYIKSLSFQDAPDYTHLRACLQQLPDEQLQLPLHRLLSQHSQQAWEPGSQQQQQQQWNGGHQYVLPGAQPQQQQQQQQQHSLPPSPYVDGLSPLDGQGLPAAGSKRARVSSGNADWDQHFKRQRGSQQQRHGSSSSPCDVEDGRQGSLGGALQGPSATPAAAEAAVGTKLVGLQYTSDQIQQPQVQAQALANGLGTISATQRAAAAGGRASEISDLLVAYDKEAAVERKAATQQAVEGLCALGPLEAVCAISMTLDKLVKQSDVSCMPAVSQLLMDLAAFAAQGASEASTAAVQQAQQQLQQGPMVAKHNGS